MCNWFKFHSQSDWNPRLVGKKTGKSDNTPSSWTLLSYMWTNGNHIQVNQKSQKCHSLNVGTCTTSEFDLLIEKPLWKNELMCAISNQITIPRVKIRQKKGNEQEVWRGSSILKLVPTQVSTLWTGYVQQIIENNYLELQE